MHATKISFINEYLYEYVVTEGSLSSGKYAIQMFDYFNILKDTFNKFDCPEYLQKELVIHIIDTYERYVGIIDIDKQKELAQAFFALPEIQNIEQDILKCSMLKKYPFYKLIPKGTFKVRTQLKERYLWFKKIKSILATKSLLL